MAKVGGRTLNHRRREEDCPSYLVEHLATFGVGQQFGLQWPSDGIRKLKQMERSSAIWAQRMVLRLRRDAIVVEDENGEIVEQFPLHLVTEPTAHISQDTRDVYNNLLVFIVNEDRQKRSATPTEMHIFQCKFISANEVSDDIRLFLNGRYSQVAPGLHDAGFEVPYSGREPEPRSMDGSPIHQQVRQEDRVVRNARFVNAARDDSLAMSSDHFERDVNTLNRCFDDIERFVARIQQAALAQRDLEIMVQRRGRRGKPHPDESALRSRAQLPIEPEFVAVFQKFKLCFNLLAKLKNHIHEPNAPELLHFLFTPLTVILDACQWGIGRPVAQNVIAPLITREAKELMVNCLTSKENEVWMTLGEAWRVPIEDWPYPLPTSFTPTFDGINSRTLPPTNNALASSAPISGASASDGGRLDLEKQRLELERERLAIKEEALRERERMIQEEKQSLSEMKRRLDEEKRSVASDHPPHLEDDYPVRLPTSRSMGDIYRDVPRGVERNVPVTLASSTGDSPRQRAFLDELRSRRCKVVQVTYDRVGQNPKELTVTKGEYLEVLNDAKKWWECRNIHNRIGYVPNTIVTAVDSASIDQNGSRPFDQPLFVRPGAGGPGGHIGSNSGPPSGSYYAHQDRALSQHRAGSVSPRGYAYSPDTPEYLRNRIGPPASHHVYATTVRRTVTPPPIRAANTGTQTEDLPMSKQPSIPPPPPPIQPLLRSQNKTPIAEQNGGPTVIKIGVEDYPESKIGSNNVELKISAVAREKTPADNLRDEITATLSKKKTTEILAQKRSGSNLEQIILSESSSDDEVGLWLEAKGFSVRTQKVLAGQTGATLFSLGKKQLQDFCGKEEGQRLYSQLLVQKNTSGYKTHSDAELKAILASRKDKADQPNGGKPDYISPVAGV